MEISPTPKELPRNSIISIHGHIRDVMTARFVVKTEEISELDFRYVAISNINASFNEMNLTSIITVGEGVVSFADSSEKTPSTEEVNKWARDAVVEDLLQRLQGDDDLYFITTVGTPQVNGQNNEEAEEPGEGPTFSVGPPVKTTDSPSDKTSLYLIIAGGGLVVLISLIVGMTFALKGPKKLVEPHHNEGKDRSENSDEIYGSENTDDSPGSDEHREISPVLAATLALESTLSENDHESLAATESSWTINTDTGDSGGIKDLSTNNSDDLLRGLPTTSPESFEYDRHISLRKDMLTSPWSGRLPSNQGVNSDSVLTPSHFSVSQEKKRRELEDGAHKEQKQEWQIAMETFRNLSRRDRSNENLSNTTTTSNNYNTEALGFVRANSSEEIFIEAPRPKARITNSIGQEDVHIV